MISARKAASLSALRARIALPAAGSWDLHLAALATTAGAILALFFDDVRQMAVLWGTMSSYKHCALIPFLVAWLVWQRAPEVKGLPRSIWWPALGGLGLAAFVWLLGAAGNIALLRHAALVGMLQMLVPFFLGPAICRALFFPIFYLIFAIPFGEELIPIFQPLTAEMAIRVLHLVGAPAVLDGIFIATPNGLYRVAQNCAGVKFLMAMLSYGVLVAHLCFKSRRRQVAFVAFSIALPVIANGIRAAATIYVGYRTSPEIAGGFDHIVFGWLFFAVVMIGMFAAGWPFFERRPGDPWLISAPAQSAKRPGKPLLAVAASLLLVFLTMFWGQMMTRWAPVPLASGVALPAVPGWERAAFNGTRLWTPHYAGADQIITGSYRAPAGQSVELSIILFRDQGEGRELIGYGQGGAGTDAKRWVRSSAGPVFPRARSEILVAPGGVRRLVVTRYVVGGVATGSALEVKLRTIICRLLGQDQAVAAILMSTQEEEGGLAARVIAKFDSAIGSTEAVAVSAIGLARR